MLPSISQYLILKVGKYLQKYPDHITNNIYICIYIDHWCAGKCNFMDVSKKHIASMLTYWSYSDLALTFEVTCWNGFLALKYPWTLYPARSLTGNVRKNGPTNGKHMYHQTSNISHTLVGNTPVDHSDVVGASPVGNALTASSFST